MAALNDIYQVRWWASSAEQASVMVRHYAVTLLVAPTPTDAEIAAALGGSTIPAAIKALMSTTATYRGVQAQRVWTLPPLVAANSVLNSGAGTVAGDGLPGQVSGVIAFRTSFAGRKFRGRVYVAFPGEADNDSLGAPIAGYVTRLDTLGTALLAQRNVAGGGGGTAQLTPCLPTKVLVAGSSPPRHVLNGGFTLLQSFLSRTIWGTQRRRGDFGRANVSPV